MKQLGDVKRGKKDSVSEFITTQYDDHKQRMIHLHREWALTLAWTRGHQNVNYNARTRQWEKPKFNAWQSRLVANKMLPIVRNKVARFAVRRSVWDTIPATSDQKDIDIARTSTKILRSKWSKLDMTTKIIRILFWQENCASAFLKVGWDTDTGPEVETDISQARPDLIQEFMRFAGLEEQPQTIKTKKGELFVNPITPFNMLFDPLSQVFDDSTYCIESQLRSMDWITDRFGNKWKDKLTETEVDTMVSPYLYLDSDSEKRDVKGVLTHELFVEPGRRFKKGIHGLLADNEFLVDPKDFPFNHGKKPYVQFLSIFDPVSAWGTCAAQQIRPQQAKYNRIESAIMDHINLTAKVQWMIPYQSGVRTITNRPGENIRYKGNKAPEQTQPKALPAFIDNELERTGRNIQDTASVHNVSQGSNETGVTSGRQVLALQDADDAVESPNLMFFNASLAKVGILVLETLNQFATQEDIIKVIGEFNELETLTYTGEMLTGESKGDYFDVRVKTLAGQTLSRSGRETLVTNLIQLQLLHPERDKDLIFDVLGTGDIGVIFDDEEVEKTRQWNEIQQITKSEQVSVLVGEDHKTHRRTIKRFFSSSQRQRLSPEILQKIQEHYLQHLKMEATEFAQEQSIIQGALNGSAQNRNNGTSSGNSNPTETGRVRAASNAITGVNTSDSFGV